MYIINARFAFAANCAVKKNVNANLALIVEHIYRCYLIFEFCLSISVFADFYSVISICSSFLTFNTVVIL